ncbi:hypothetical protein TWF106_002864 [Orbilia oligospora]|uniref:Uncharacterized protein n=1 Tax=Orbilia oligospora TaxID=2813651 RepID=A0A6G1LZ66_ORBOL|nr:hypothetical protein TWF788_006966 [Orbilia oligospora]KAF3201325.1 hypothetical protein TWF106_002864 [Orbilia oligospora]KAF3218021.1 hypothetical protein TWF679_001433 [Orbilia oligospora]KAF3218689.1 hypothetical protein TWF191_008135 [Orbilia oligospora]KAF3239237.1 hypothetical protein TWF192_010112 [Orbilia oligospora]
MELEAQTLLYIRQKEEFDKRNGIIPPPRYELVKMSVSKSFRLGSNGFTLIGYRRIRFSNLYLHARYFSFRSHGFQQYYDYTPTRHSYET